jgi:hypothetical protein
LKLNVLGAGLLGPGLPSWREGQAVLRGETAHQPEATVLPAPLRLPPAERRRAGDSIRLAMAVADQAITSAEVDPGQVATVFTSSSGEGMNCHLICETLASSSRLLSPTRFTNSVHNAAAGYWHIAVANRASSTSVCAHDGSLAAGLLEAMALAQTSNAPVLLVATDTPYPEPMNSVRCLPHAFGMALLLSRSPASTQLGTLQLDLAPPQRAGATASIGMVESLELLRQSIPAARGLPLLQALASPAEQVSISLAGAGGMELQIKVSTARDTNR